MKVIHMLVALIFSSIIVSCASLNSVSVTPIPAERNKVVEVEKSRWIIFFLNFDNDYVDSAVTDLKSQCSKGKVSGILTKDETYTYFLFVSKRVLKARGYCVPYKRG
jgi:hypothetical protein